MTEYMLVFPEKPAAESVADELAEDDAFSEVRVMRDELAGEDDGEAADWAVYVRVDTLEDHTSAPARALSERFGALATERGGWLDEDVSPPADLAE